MRRLIAALVMVAIVGVACGGSDSKSATQPAGNNATTPAQVSLTAVSAVDALAAKGMPIGERTQFTAETDPNHLLGRPGGYTSKTAFIDTRLEIQGDKSSLTNGGSVEVFASDTEAKQRKDYITGIVKTSPLLTEYTYQRGRSVLRLSSRLTPDQAAQYEQAFQAVPEK